MCSIIAWSGKLSKGLLTRLLIESESRGKDSTGVAFRAVEAGKPCNLCYRHIVPARAFVDIHKSFMSDARRSHRGIGHTRRASPGMPVDNQNAHPFTYPKAPLSKFYFAHNGRIVNWLAVKADFAAKYGTELTNMATDLAMRANVTPELVEEALFDNTKPLFAQLKASDGDLLNVALGTQSRLSYVNTATTDSQVLGPCIENRDFSKVDGCMALVWMRADNVYAFRLAKEGVCATMLWRYKEPMDDEPKDDQTVTIVASTKKIVEEAVARLESTVEIDLKWLAWEEGSVYRITPLELVNEGRVPIHAAIADEFSSAETPDTAEATEVADEAK